MLKKIHNPGLGKKQGCRCKKINCRSRYCACFTNGIACTQACDCTNCHNDKCMSKKTKKSRKSIKSTSQKFGAVSSHSQLMSSEQNQDKLSAI